MTFQVKHNTKSSITLFFPLSEPKILRWVIIDNIKFQEQKIGKIFKYNAEKATLRSFHNRSMGYFLQFFEKMSVSKNI